MLDWLRFILTAGFLISGLLILITSVIGSFQVFGSIYILTNGGPMQSTVVMVFLIYQRAFKYFQMGYGSALAWVFAVILLILTWVQMTWSNRWVYYAGE